MTSRVLNVWWEAMLVGDLVQDEHGDLSFTYYPGWLEYERRQPLSRSLPLRPEPFSRRECRPFFAGLLPEAEQRIGVAGALGVSEANDFALLDGIGGDVAGAISLLPKGVPQRIVGSHDPAVELSDDRLAEMLDRLPARPLLAGEGMRLSLAGVQPKVPVLLVDGRPALPGENQPTTHIIKPEIARFKGSVQNEAWCMQLATGIGLDVASVEAREVHGRPYLLVSRYDRALENGIVHRLHQEDACQALGIAPGRKYAAEGGPAFRDLFELTRKYSRLPAVDILKLVDAAIFNLIIGNADAHGKNFSFLLDGRGPRLAPLYDLLATIAWPGLSTRMAMRIGGRAGTIDELDREAWERFAADAGITFPFLRRSIRDVAQRVIMAIAREAALMAAADLAERTRLRASAVAQSVGD